MAEPKIAPVMAALSVTPNPPKSLADSAQQLPRRKQQLEALAPSAVAQSQAQPREMHRHP